MSKKREYPHQQSFNVGARRNQTKKNSWWAHAPFHNNQVNRKGNRDE